LQDSDGGFAIASHFALMLIEANQLLPHLGPGNIEAITLDHVIADIDAVMDIFVGRTAVHSAAHICSLETNPPKVDPLHGAIAKRIVNYSFNEYVSIRLELEAPIGLDHLAHAGPRIAEVVEHRISPDRKILK
jgi:hypothetical protein